MRRKWLLVIGIALVIVAAASFYFAWERARDRSINRGPVWEAVELTLGPYGSSNPVKDDLIKRGLVTDEDGRGSILISEIEKLVNEGVYAIDEQGYLKFGPVYRPPT